MIHDAQIRGGANAQVASISGYDRIPWWVLPLLRCELPGWGKLAQRLKILGAECDPLWRGAPWKVMRGKWHGYQMRLNLSDWSDRQAYFLGRYSELAIQLLIDACVRPGDRVVDVGANIGHLTLHTANRVGPSGTVEAFEPNPVCCDRIAEALLQNQIRQVTLHRMALSDEPGRLKLRVLGNHLGEGTLAIVPDEYVTDSAEVDVKTGDDMLLCNDRPISFIKMDVEGFETRALRGMKSVLKRWQPIVATEVIEAWLNRAGSSYEELASLMRSIGYQPFSLSTRRRMGRHRLSLAPFTDSILPGGVYDVAWLPAATSTNGRLSKFIESPR